MKSFWKKSESVRTQGLKLIQACLVIAVGIVSGCIVVAFAGEILGFIFWLLNLGLLMTIAFVVGWAITAIVQRAMDAIFTGKVDRVANIIRPFVWNNIEPDDAPFAS